MMAARAFFISSGSRGSQEGWRCSSIPGLKAVDMFRAVEEGKIKALWIISTNPAVSMLVKGPIGPMVALLAVGALWITDWRADRA